jgi:hypothetical protein
MILRIILIGTVAAGLLVFAKQDRVLARVGIVGTCVPSLPAAGSTSTQRRAQWWSCSEGTVMGYPSLELKSCHSGGFYGKRELWYCQQPIASPY